MESAESRGEENWEDVKLKVMQERLSTYLGSLIKSLAVAAADVAFANN